MLNQAQIQDFQENGFLSGDQILNNDQVEELRTELDRIVNDARKTTRRQPVRIIKEINMRLWVGIIGYGRMRYRRKQTERIYGAVVPRGYTDFRQLID